MLMVVCLLGTLAGCTTPQPAKKMTVPAPTDRVTPRPTAAP